eukprot:1160591-Pelagomonas_calceolata.AAC.4
MLSIWPHRRQLTEPDVMIEPDSMHCQGACYCQAALGQAFGLEKKRSYVGSKLSLSASKLPFPSQNSLLYTLSL